MARLKKPTMDDAKKAAKLIFESCPQFPIESIYVYGSVARDEATDESDIDLAVVCQPFEETKIREVRAIYKHAPNVPNKTMIITLHPEELNNQFSIVGTAIRKDGIALPK
jgi:predicted nucleotidyltransferase